MTDSVQAGAEGGLGVEVSLEFTDRVNFAMQQHGVPLVDELAVTNTGEAAIEVLELRLELPGGLCEPWVSRLDRLEPGGTFRVIPAGFGLRGEALATRTEAERVSLVATAQSGDLQAIKQADVDVLAFDQWPGVGHLPELTAAFVTPNHAGIGGLLAAARSSLGGLSDRDALDGYQSGSRQRAALIGEACFAAMAGRELGYINPPASFDVAGQRVRLVDRVLREGLGTCLDLSLMLAGMWEQCGLHPVIVMPEGHAMAGFWTHESHLPEPVIDEPARIRNLVALGELVIIESTLLTQKGASFAESVRAAETKMRETAGLFCAVDVRSCRKRGIRPLPLRDDGTGSAVDLSQAGAVQGKTERAETVLASVALADRVAGAAPSAGHDTEGRIARWQRRLLDLSLRNRLINFRESGRTVRLAVPDVGLFEDGLSAEQRFEVRSKAETADAAFLADELSGGRVYASLTDAECQKRLLTLYRTAKTSLEETGANLLHVAVGMLRWYESASAESARMAPLLLLPVRLYRHATGSGYRYEIELTDEPARVNVTLLEKLRVEFGIESAGLSELPEDENGIDVPLVLRRFREAIRDSARWEVDETVQLGLFSFNKFLMWRDLRENMDGLRRNRLVRHLVDGGSGVFDTEPLRGADGLDEEIGPGDLLCTRDADSTQLAAVRAASDGRSFVLEGPPGTGKSQTIANIIADALSKGRRVLFVAEKMAALSVVRRRLEKDGLGVYCLELHSAKASKREVLAQLGASLQGVAGWNEEAWNALCAELATTRAGLNGYVHELHRERASGESVYRVLGRLARLGGGARVAPASESVRETTRERLAVWRDAIRGIEERGSAVDPVHAHALRGIGRSSWSFELPERAGAVLNDADRAAGGLESAADALLAGAQMRVSCSALSGSALRALVTIGSLLRDGVRPERSMLVGADAASVREAVRGATTIGRERDAERARLLESYRQELFETDLLGAIERVSAAAKKPGPLRWVFGWFAKRGLRRFAVSGLPGLDALRSDLEAVREVGLRTRELEGMTLASAGLGSRWNNGAGDWDEAERVVNWAERFSVAADALSKDPSGRGVGERLREVATGSGRTTELEMLGGALASAHRDWSQAWTSVEDELAAEIDDTDGLIAGAVSALGRWRSGLSGLNAWCAWRTARDAAVESGLGDLIEACETGEIGLDEVSDAFERGFGEKWFVATADGSEALRGFSETGYERAIDRFRELDSKVVAEAQHAVTGAIGASMPSLPAQASAQSELGILRRELEKKRRHLPPRRLIEAMPNLLPRLKPCFLMSPLSVAQYLDAGLPPFDLVVFDEASQIPVWDAVGAIARGSEVIVVGDSKQLPPTTFFNTIDDEDDEDPESIETEDMESILQECNASGVPGLRLGWHYRSRHESLIAFSNHHYYENELHTFPSPMERSEWLGVTLRHVADGVYDRGGSRTNRVEAESVVAAVVEMLTGERASESVGIVTFNLAQQSLIEDLLDVARREHPEIERFFTDAVEEPVFVKNLENVQGDERDAIVFSVGYGPDANGKPSMNFGPLNKEGGERRLNVAVTRARRRLVVFSSLRGEDIDLRRTRAVGVRHFKTFLDYADRGPLAIAGAGDAAEAEAFGAGFEGVVQRALEARGWVVDARVGCGGYRVDLGVRDPDRPGMYLLGIECDGGAYRAAKTARDRDRTRWAVMRGLGWRLERVWSTAWRIDEAGCIAQLEAALARATAEASKGETLRAGVNSVVESAAPQPETKREPLSMSALGRADQSEARTLPVYVVAKRTSRRLAKLDVFDDRATELGVEAVIGIVSAEGPVVEEIVLRRLAEWFGVARVTEKYRARVSELIGLAVRTGDVRADGDSYWSSGVEPGSYRDVRVPGRDEDSIRELDLVPLVERVNAVELVVREQFGLPRDALIKEVARVLGAVRVTSRVGEALEEGVNAALTSGRVLTDGDRIVLCG